MQTVAGLRNGILYTIHEPPYDPRWSKKHIHKFLSICATGMSLGWNEQRAISVGEAIVFKQVLKGIQWMPGTSLSADILRIESLVFG
jgi:hypothetical protein